MSGANAHEPRRGERYDIDDALIGYLRPSSDDVILELGHGRTLSAIAEHAPTSFLLGMDIDRESLEEASAALADAGTRYALVQADVSEPLCLGALADWHCFSDQNPVPQRAGADLRSPRAAE